jgi:CheY-like chemotaxis protein
MVRPTHSLLTSHGSLPIAFFVTIGNPHRLTSLGQPDCADGVGMLLRKMGNGTRTAYDGQQGLEVARGFRPDVARLDIGLPKPDGYEACRHICEQPWGKGVVLIAVTG